MEQLIKQIQQYLLDTDKINQGVLFTTQNPHPLFADNTQVLETAQSDLLNNISQIPGEQTLAFVGIRATIPLSGQKKSIGFLITNFRIIIQNTFSLFKAQPKVSIIAFTQKQQGDQVALQAWEIFFKINALGLSADTLYAIKQNVINITAIVLPQVQALHIFPLPTPVYQDLIQHITALHLDGVLEPLTAQNKPLQDFVTQNKITDLLYGCVKESLLTGVSGLAITKQGIVCKDAFKKLCTLSWAELKDTPLIWDAKHNSFSIEKSTFTLSKQQTPYGSALIGLINDIAEGKVSLQTVTTPS